MASRQITPRRADAGAPQSSPLTSHSVLDQPDDHRKNGTADTAADQLADD
jgi:hypothetical protein